MEVVAYDGTLKFDTQIDASGFQMGLDKLTGFASGAMKTVTSVIAGGAAALAGLGADAVKVGSEFDHTMSKVSAISGAVGDDFDALRGKAIEMGGSTKFSANEAAEAFTYMSMAGWRTEDMLNGIEGIMNLAAASGEDLARTSDIVTDALTAFGLTAADSAHFADVLAAASSSANTNVGMMGETFKYVAPLAGALKLSVEDTAEAIGLMANAGIKASQAGTTLRTGLARLVKPTEEMKAKMIELGLAVSETYEDIDPAKIEKAQNKVNNKLLDLEKAQINYNDALEKYGADSSQTEKAMLSLEKVQNDLELAYSNLEAAQNGESKTAFQQGLILTDTEGNMRSLNESVDVLREAFAGLSETEQAEAAYTLFGQEAMTGFLALINAAPKDIEKVHNAIANCTDELTGYSAAAEMAAIAEDNLQGDLTTLGSALETLKIRINDELTPSLRDYAKFGVQSVREVTEAFQNGGFDGLVTAAGGVFAQIAVMAADAAPALIDAAVSLTGSFIQAVLDNGEAFSAAGVELVQSFVTAVLSLTGDFGIAAIELFTQFLTGFAERMPELVQTGQKMIFGLCQSLIDNAPSMLESASTIVVTLLQGVGDALPEMASMGVRLLETLSEGIVTNLPKIADAAASVLKNFGGYLRDNLPELLKAGLEVLVSLSGSIRENAGKLVDAGLDLLKNLAKGFADSIPTLIQNVPTIISNIAGCINDNAPKIIAAGIEIIMTLIVGIVKAIPTLIAEFPKIIKAIVDVITAFNWLALGKTIITGILNGIKSLFTTVPNALRDMARTASDIITHWNWKSLGKGILISIRDGVTGFLGNFKSAVTDALKNIITHIKSVWSNHNWLQLGIDTNFVLNKLQK